MRMFLTGMTDIFLILYLTSLSNVPKTSVLTVEDFYKLNAMHESLQSDKKREQQEFQEKIRQVVDAMDLLNARLASEQAKALAAEASLRDSINRLATVDQDLQSRNDNLKEKEKLLAAFDRQISEKESGWQKKENEYRISLEEQKVSANAQRLLAEKLQLEAQKAQRLAEEKLIEVQQANMAAQQARAAQEKAFLLKEQALEEKSQAETRARDALAAQWKADAEREQAVKAAREAQQKAETLAALIEDIRQDSESAFKANVRPLMQLLNVRYEQEVSKNISVVKRELTLLPVQVNGQTVVFLPSRHIGFSRAYDHPPRGLSILFKGKKLSRGYINTEHDIVAIPLSVDEVKALRPYEVNTPVQQFMPVLLALRNSGDRSFTNLFRGLSDEYFALNRDHLHSDKESGLVHDFAGFRGTGMRAERILQGDQLVDLKGRLIGIARDVDRILRIDSLNGWKDFSF